MIKNICLQFFLCCFMYKGFYKKMRGVDQTEIAATRLMRHDNALIQTQPLFTITSLLPGYHLPQR